MRILILGASGLLGWDFYRFLKTNHEVIGTYGNNQKEGLVKLDITERLRKQFINVDVVINCLAMTDVDKCEIEQKKAKEINTDFLDNVLDFCKGNDAFLLHISSDYIFSGKDKIVYENTISKPCNFYGLTKMYAEDILKDYKKKTIIRPTKLYNYELLKQYWLYEKSYDNFLVKYPTWTMDIVYNFEKWINSPGIYNLSSLIALTEYQYVNKVLELVESPKKIYEKSCSFKVKIRPLNVKYDLSKILKLGIVPHSVEEIIRWEMKYGL